MAPDLKSLLKHDGLLHNMPREKLHVLQGEVMNVYLGSKYHSSSSLVELFAWIMPAIHFNQFRMYHQGGRPIAWVTWALMKEAEGTAYVTANQDFDFTPETWQSGDQIWFIDFIAPYGHALKVAYDLKRNVFPNRAGFAPDIDMETGERRVRKLFGVNLRDQTPVGEDNFIEQAAAN